MARQTKARASTAAKPSDVTKVPSETALKSLLRACKNTDADRNEATGRKGALIAAAVDKNHLDKGAWADVLRYERMSTAKARVRRDHFLYYMDALGINDRLDTQEEMFARPEVGEQEPDTSDIPEAGKEFFDKAKFKPAKEPRPGSFAAKLQEQQRTTSLTNPKLAPTPAEVKAAADRAERDRTTH